MTSPGAPRWTLAVLCSIVAALCAWAAAVLPWRAATTFTLATGAVGLCHAATALLAWLGSAARARAWRLQTAVSLLYLGYLTWNVVMASASIEALYGGLGRGVAVVLALGWLLVALVLVPLSVWCLTVHGGWPRKRHGVVAVVVLGCLGWTGASRARARVTATPVIGAWTEPTRVAEGVVSALPPGSARLPESRPRRNSWVPTTGTHCVRPPAQSPITILASWQRGDPDGRIEHACVQAESLEAARADVRALFADRVTPVAFAFDVVTAVDPLERVAPIVDALLLRPGVDGVCQSVVCLAPWQLLASDAFGALRPVPAIPELRFGFDPQHLRGLMGVQAGADVAGLVRIETASFVVDAEGRPQRLRRLRRPGPAVARASLEAGRRAAEHYILAAQNDDGRFEYHRDPFRGEVSNADFSLARQAGTTLALCEVAEDRTRAREAARASLRMLMSTQRQFRGLGAPQSQQSCRLDR